MLTDIISQPKTMAEKTWEYASEPDYDNNEDLIYPYSELPYFGMYYLVKIPIEGDLVHHVDYWGEGKINYLNEVRGFSNSYNVNEQFALVTQGPGEGKKIPNRIPVVNTQDCDTSSYIEADTVKIVTVSRKAISKQCAADIARIVKTSEGLVVAYGYADTSYDIKYLAQELGKKGLYYVAGYDVPADLKFQTAFSTRRVFADRKSITDHLYYLVTGADYINAVATIRSLVNNNGAEVCREVVEKLVSQGMRNTMSFAYKLWAEHKDIVINYFPTEFRLIFEQQRIKIISNHFKQALILDANADSINDRLVWGDSKDSSSNRVSWKLIPYWENNTVFFKILNTEHNMYLKLDVNVDKDYGDRQAWGSNDSGEMRHGWYLYPVKVDNKQLFLIENREYRQGLKLNANVDDGGYGDRQVWGHNGSVASAPSYYGFLFQSWN